MLCCITVSVCIWLSERASPANNNQYERMTDVDISVLRFSTVKIRFIQTMTNKDIESNKLMINLLLIIKQVKICLVSCETYLVCLMLDKVLRRSSKIFYCKFKILRLTAIWNFPYFVRHISWMVFHYIL